MVVQQQPRGYWSADDVDLDELAALTTTTTSLEQYPHATAVDREVVVYDMAELGPALAGAAGRRAVMSELAHVLQSGSGVFALRNAVASDPLDAATEAFNALIEVERNSAGGGDHFAAAGANDRVWNALEKLAISAPEVFVDYYASDALALASEAWLGPAYQMTSQLNVVNPGGAAQRPHRDYHLGFMGDEQAGQYPAHVHALSSGLTLQGAVAHVDMPVETGPTKYLPHSHKYPPGYLAWRNPDVIDHFEAEFVQLPLTAGDAVFFNPAMFHAAGTNQTGDVRRMANLLQVSSAFGRAMETVDRSLVVRAVYPALLHRQRAGWPTSCLAAALAASAEGYPFPTNLDRDQPTDSLTPLSQADLLRRALTEGWPPEELGVQLDAYGTRRATT